MSPNGIRTIDEADLEGPRVSRRTAVKLFSAAGYTGVATALAGCGGGDGGGDGGDGGDGSDGTGGDGGDDDDGGDGSDGGDGGDGMGSDRYGGSINTAFLVGRMPSWNPHEMDGEPVMNVGANAFSGLVRMTSAGIIGDVAQDWTIEADGTRWVFDLRDTEIKYHNGDTLTAEHIQRSFEIIKNRPDAFNKGPDENVTNIEIPDSGTIVLETDEAYAPLLAALTIVPGRTFGIIHPDEYEADPDGYKTEPVGTGPFQITETRTGEYTQLERFDDYFLEDDDGNQLPYLDAVRVSIVPESNTVFSGLRAQEIDYAQRLGGELAEQARSLDYLNVRGFNPARTEWVNFLCNEPHEHPDWVTHVAGYDESQVTDKWEDEELVTANPDVRRALSMAIDKQDVVDRAYLGWAEPATHLANPTIAWLHQACNEEDYPYQNYDPDEAERLLDEAGYTGDPRFSIRALVEVQYERIWTVLQEHWSQIGVDLEIDIVEAAAYDSTYINYEHEAVMYYGGNDIDPSMFWVNQFHTPNRTGFGIWQKGLYSNPDFDERVREMLVTPDIEARTEVCVDAMNIINEDVPASWLTWPQAPEVSHTRLENFDSVFGVVNFHSAYVTE